MVRHAAILLLVVSGSILYAQTDSLLRVISISQGEEKVDALVELARFYQTGYPDSVLKYGQLALAAATDLGYDRGKASGLWAIGLGHRLSANYPESLAAFYRARKWAQISESKELESEIDMGIGGVHYYQNATDSAMTYFIKAAKSFEELGLEKRLASAYSNVGIIMNINNEGRKALTYFLKSLHYAEKNNQLNMLLPVYVNLATYYQQINRYDSVLYYADACYQIAKKNNLPYGMARALMILPKAYSNKEAYDRALALAEEGIDIFKSLGDSLSVKNLVYEKAVALRGLGQYKRALHLCDSLLPYLDDSQVLKEDTYLLGSEILERLGKSEKALAYHKRFFELYQNASIEKQKQLISEMEIKYDTERKSREISDLNNKATIQAITIKQQNWIIIGSILLAAIVVALIVLFSRQRLLMKENRLLEMEQRFLRSQMNPHFIFNALGAIQKFILKNDPIEGASFISKFGTLMRQFLNHSRQNYISLEEEVKTLTNYLAVQQLRFDSKFNYSIEVERGIDQQETFIPPLLAQPFIENAVEHGISEKETPGKIEVYFSKHANGLMLTIRDNGNGLQTTRKEDHHSLAIRITRDRLNLLNGKKTDPKLSISNLTNSKGAIEGVEVSLIVPVKG